MKLKEDEPAEEWQPKNGELVSVSDDGVEWAESAFIGINKLSDYKYVTYHEDGVVTSWMKIRKIKTLTRKQAEEVLGLKIID